MTTRRPTVTDTPTALVGLSSGDIVILRTEGPTGVRIATGAEAPAADAASFPLRPRDQMRAAAPIYVWGAASGSAVTYDDAIVG